MTEIYFWKSWSKPFRVFFYFLSTLLLASVVWLLTERFVPGSSVYFENSETETNDIFLPIFSFISGVFAFDVEGNYFLNTQRFSTFSFRPDTIAPKLLFVAIILGISLYASAIVRAAKNLWFYVGLIPLVFFPVLLQLDNLINTGYDFRILTPAFIFLLAGTAFLYRSFLTKSKAYIRLIVFLAINTLVTVVLYKLPHTADPINHIASFGIFFPIIAGLVFILFVSYEPLVWFLYLSNESQFGKGSSGFTNFLVLSLLYIGVIVVGYLSARGIISWELNLFDPFVLLLISGIGGLWGFRRRQRLYSFAMNFRNVALYLYFSLGIMCFAIIAYIMRTENDPLLETFEDFILLTHMSMGLVFVLYILSNFSGAMSQNLKVQKFLYKPLRTPAPTIPAVGLIIMFLLLGNAQWYPFFQAVAGHSNTLGDYYLQQGDKQLANGYYQTGRLYDITNHRSNYCLAGLQRLNQNYKEEIELLTLATKKTPRPFTYIALAEAYQRQDDLFKSIFTLSDGLKKFPNSGMLSTNLALAYAKTTLSDSVIFHLTKALDNLGKDNTTAEANYLYAQGKLGAPALPWANDLSSNPLLLANQTVLQSISGKHVNPNQANVALLDTQLTGSEFTALYNILLNTATHHDTSLHSTAVKLAQNSQNKAFRKYLLSAASYNYALGSSLQTGMKNLKNIADVSTTQLPRVYHNLGLLHMWQGNPQQAIPFFDEAINRGYIKANLHAALAHALTSNYTLALNLLAQYKNKTKNPELPVDTIAMAITKQTAFELKKLNPATRLTAFTIHINNLPTDTLLSVAKSFKQPQALCITLCKLGMRALIEENYALAAQIETLLPDPTNLNPHAKGLFALFNGYWSLTKGKPENTITYLNKSQLPHYLTAFAQAPLAKAYWLQGDTAMATSMFNKALNQAPYHLPSVLLTAQYALNSGGNASLAFELLKPLTLQYPQNPGLLKMLTLVAIENKFWNYAEQKRLELKKILPQKQFETFDSEYKAIYERNFNIW